MNPLDLWSLRAGPILIGALLSLAAAPSVADPIFVSTNLNGLVSNGDNRMLDMTPDGRYLLFRAEADDMAPGDSNGFPDLVVLDRMSNSREIVTAGATFSNLTPAEVRFEGRMSANGRFVVFESNVRDLVPGPHNDFRFQVYVRDRVAAETRRATSNDLGEPLEDDSLGARISDDGRYVAFMTGSPSIAGTEDPPQVYQVDMTTGARSIVTRNRGGIAPAVTGTFAIPSMSGDGRWVVFDALAILPGLPPDVSHIYLWDRTDDSLEVISRTPAGVLGDGQSWSAVISRDGRYVMFTSFAANLTGRPAGELHWLRKDLVTGAIDPVDLTHEGEQIAHTPSASVPPQNYISSDGRFLSFFVTKWLIPGAAPQPPGGMYVRDMQRIRSVMVGNDREGGIAGRNGPVTDDGRHMAFSAGMARVYPPGLTVPDNKVAENGDGDVFLEDMLPVDISVRVAQFPGFWNTDVTVRNESQVQATRVALHFSSVERLRIVGSNYQDCFRFALLLPAGCTVVHVPPGGEVLVRLSVEPSPFPTVSFRVDADLNEIDPNFANNSAQVTLVAPPAPPPPRGGGGGGALRWLDVAGLAFLLLNQSAAMTRARARARSRRGLIHREKR